MSLNFSSGVNLLIGDNGVGKTTVLEALALSVVMSVNYLAIVLCPFIIDLLRNILHMQGERFPFILSAGLAFVAVLLTWRYRNSYAFGLDKSYYRQ